LIPKRTFKQPKLLCLLSADRPGRRYTWDMEIDLGIVGYTIKVAEQGQCSGIYQSHDSGQAKMGKCPTNPIFAIYKDGSKDPDYRCWKHFREFLVQNPGPLADIVIHLLLKNQSG